ncbi:MAG TPA: MFS transporter [Candidatus Dormibacteraeota bacterium]|nr:MFS transporter [Candidatus Dormibacteraeota bacterium]
MRRTTFPRRGERWNTGLLYLLAGLTTLGQGSMELTFPLNLHHLGSALPLVGLGVAVMGAGQIVSRLPGGHWYRPDSAPLLNAAFLASHGLTTIALALTPLWILQALFVALHGAAFGLVTTFQLAMLIDSRRREGSMAASIAWYTAAISLGYAAGSPLGAAAIERFGYAGAFWVSGGVTVVAAALSLTAVPPKGQSETTAPSLPGWRGLLRALATLPVSIWVAALLALYLNFITDSVASFFPIYAVGIGISLGFVGLLRGLNSLVGAAIRLLAVGMFRVVRPEPANHASVLAMAAAVLALSLFTSPAALLIVFIVLGASRGIVRITSATLVADERARLGRSVGLASAVYNSGLDAGVMLAPPATGLIAGTVGIPAAFRIVAIGLPLLYYVAWTLARARRPEQAIQARSR